MAGLVQRPLCFHARTGRVGLWFAILKITGSVRGPIYLFNLLVKCKMKYFRQTPPVLGFQLRSHDRGSYFIRLGIAAMNNLIGMLANTR